MSELLLEKKLRESEPEDEVRTIARVRTLTVLRRLDGERKRNVLTFLQEASLIDKGKQIIDLKRADLSGAKLINTELVSVDLGGTNLRFADLRDAYLSSVDLS